MILGENMLVMLLGGPAFGLDVKRALPPGE